MVSVAGSLSPYRTLAASAAVSGACSQHDYNSSALMVAVTDGSPSRLCLAAVADVRSAAAALVGLSLGARLPRRV
jgi:hypothetical protein